MTIDAVCHPLQVMVAVIMLGVMAACETRPENAEQKDAVPTIFPDYVGVTVPVGIAPLNFNYAGRDTIDGMDVVVKGSRGGELHSNGDYASFDIDDWHELLEQNKGGQLSVTVCTRHDGRWTQYRDFVVYVSTYPLDEWGLTYRRIAPGYEVYSTMGLYQRCLADFTEKPIFENTAVPGQCVNCHTSNRTNPDQFVFHVRGQHGATMVQMNGKREWLKASNEELGGSMVYPYWHPSGRYCAFSTNQTRQAFHVVPDERIEVFDLSSDLLVYNPLTHEILTDSLISTKDWSENVPVFSSDGRTLYFLTCKQQDYPENYRKEQYNLCKIDFNPDDGSFGDHVDTLVNAVAMGKSVTWPRPSYDGKWLMFTLQDYGYFSVWHEESDQWMLNLQTGEAWPVAELNSSSADSYHNWNVNSHWVVFTSRRGGGLYTRLYLAAIDEHGKATKPFLLPQEKPWEYYHGTLYSFNVPDFTAKPVEFDKRRAAREILSDDRIATQVRK